MPPHNRKRVIIALIVAATLTLHVLFHNHTASFFIFPLVIASIVAFTGTGSLSSMLVLIAVSELYSSLTLGVMTGIIALPFIANRIFKKTEAEFSGRFFLLVAGVTTIQIITMTLMTSIGTIALKHLPLMPFVFSVIGSTALAYTIIVLWYELGMNRI